MEKFHLLSFLKRPLKRYDFTYSRELFIPALGLIPLAYVFYTGFLNLPPILTNVVVFTSIFVGLSVVLHWRKNYFIIPLLFVYLGLFILPLTWLWRGLEFDDNVLMGIFPFNDGMNYLVDAYRLLMGLGTMIMYNGRPLFSGLLAFFMWIFDGNIQIALAVFCAGAAISIFLLALEVREIAGPFAAGITSAVLFYFYLPFLGRINTENLGLIFGALALPLLLRGARKSSLTTLAIGAFTLSIALNARPGALFTLPILVLWSWVNRKTFGWKAPLILIGAIAIGFILNNYLIKSISMNEKDTFSNFGHSLYGLASGYKGWAYVYKAHPELNNTSNVLPLALELIRKNPFLLFVGILLNYKDYFTPQGMFYIMNFSDQQLWISWILYLITLVGFFRLVKSRDGKHWSLFLFLVAGIFLSLAVIPNNDYGLRILMATNPVNALVAGLAFLPIQNQQKKDVGNIRTVFLEVYAVILGVVCVLGPLVVVNFPHAIHPLSVLDCPEGTEQISVIVTPGSYINIVRNGPTFGFLPEVKKSDIKTRLDDYYRQGNVPYILTDFPAFERLVKRLKPGDTILMGLNLVELNIGDGPHKFVFLVTRTNQIQKIGDVNNFCARLSTEDRLRGNRFYYDQSIDINE
jgi:hypothetical protein